MTSFMPDLLDLRGMRCPWPALRVARAIREAGPGAELRVMADDPAAPREIEAVAAERGWHFSTESGEIGPVMRLRSS
jgi:tRNA 2-thiouridine synthesizing protein A